LPAHRERLFTPTETLSIFPAQVLSADGSCRQAVDEAVIKRIIGGLLRGLLDALEADDILLGDAFYATYCLLCELVQRGVDGVFKQ